MLDSSTIHALETIVGSGNVIAGSGELIAYSYDSQSVHAVPDAVVSPGSTAETAEVVKLAASRAIPVIPRGAGSGMTGGSVPERGGIVLNMERMNRILRIDPVDRIGILEPGVITGDFQDAAAKLGLFYPPEPASSRYSSVGGNIAESAGGLGCVKYGLTKQFIAGLEFVTADGTVVTTGVFSEAGAPFDIGAVLAGSEGMLAVVTKVTLRLIPLPKRRVTMLALFRSLADAALASNAVLASGAGPSVLEFMDGDCIETVREYAEVDIPDGTGALLIVELDGDADEVDAGSVRVEKALSGRNPISVRSAEDEKTRVELWKLRKSVSPAIAKIAPLKFNEDICVPLSKIPEMCTFVEQLGKRNNVKVVTFGHSGDGNLHVNFMTHFNRPDEIGRVKSSIVELFGESVRQGGTLSGEHGIGIAKRPYIGIALDGATIEYEKRIMAAFDPAELFNPGKMFPA